jgi:hypothetical protein
MSGTIGGLSPATLYLQISKNESADVTRFEGYDPATKAAIARFQQQAPNLTTPDALLKDYRSLQVVLGAFNMSADIGDTALLKQLMTQNPSASTSLASRSGNPSYMRFAQAMSTWTPPPLANAQSVATIVTQFATNNFEASEGAQNTGLQQALYFRRMIGSVTSIAQLMSDATLTSVAVTGSGLPSQFGLLDYSQQVPILTKALDLSKFKDPSYVDRFVEKYFAETQASQSGSTTNATGILSLFSGSGATGGTDLLNTLFGSTSSASSQSTSLLGALFSTTA